MECKWNFNIQLMDIFFPILLVWFVYAGWQLYKLRDFFKSESKAITPIGNDRTIELPSGPNSELSFAVSAFSCSPFLPEFFDCDFGCSDIAMIIKPVSIIVKSWRCKKTTHALLFSDWMGCLFSEKRNFLQNKHLNKPFLCRYSVFSTSN